MPAIDVGQGLRKQALFKKRGFEWFGLMIPF